MASDLLVFERSARDSGFTRIAGVDEAGRGPLAGPVVSAAVILPEGFRSDDVTDSKALSEKKRAALLQLIYQQATAIGIGIVDAVEIDRVNILQASLLSMAFAVANLTPAPDYLLIDGIFRVPCTVDQEAIAKGDARSLSIAAASIVAKVTRDRLMARYHEEFPEFGFDRHKGYPTAAHKAAIRTHGPCPIHRRTFRGVREVLGFGPVFDASADGRKTTPETSNHGVTEDTEIL
ncbi:MAG: ribonuclease HII [Pseudomonadota bacterium]